MDSASAIGSSPIIQLAVAAALGLLVRRFPSAASPAPTAAPAVVMAIGIFGLAALQEIPTADRMLTQPLAIGLLALWTFIAASFVASYFSGTFDQHIGSPVARFTIGTWVAGTAALVRMLVLALPEWRPLALLLALLACAVWLWYLTLAAKSLRAVAGRAFGALVPGAVLLLTVSTQSLSIAAVDLFPDVPAWRSVASSLVVLGGLLYPIGGVLVVRSHLRVAGWSLKDDWANTNCMLHGAMSITGLALVTSDAAPRSVALGIWLYVLCAFVAVEGIEVARLASRVRAYGWRRGALAYHVTQWSRVFTFGMFYAFTRALSQQPGPEAAWPVQWAQASVLAYGPYVVLLVLLAEMAIYIEDRRTPQPQLR